MFKFRTAAMLSVAACMLSACASAETVQSFKDAHNGSNSPFDQAQHKKAGVTCADQDVARAGGYFIGGTFYPVQCQDVQSHTKAGS